MKKVNQDFQAKIYDALSIPPSRANIQVVGMLPTTEAINNKFFQLGLTAADLNPIDWRKQRKLSTVLNQQNCGDCWAMSSTSALADRFIIKNNLEGLRLNPAVTAQCAQATAIDQGCNGGFPFLAGKYFEQFGVPEISGDECVPWDSVCKKNCSSLPSCKTLKSQCQKNTQYFAVKDKTENLTAKKSDGSIDIPTTIANIKRELMNGPVVAAYFVPRDFMAPGFGYKWKATNGIYINGAYGKDLTALNLSGDILQKMGVTTPESWAGILTEGGSPAAHAVSIVGWDRGKAGSFGNVSYWIVRNSWGPEWNDEGFFKIAMNDGTGNNTSLGFDIPIGMGNNLFGGCIKFDPDLKTGATPNPNPTSPPGEKGKKKSNILLYFVIGISVILLIWLVIYFYKNDKMGSKSSSKKGKNKGSKRSSRSRRR